MLHDARKAAKNRLLGRKTFILRVARYLFLASGTILLSYSGYAVADRYDYQLHEQNTFEATPITNVNAEQHSVADGEVVGQMEIARLGLKVIVVQGDSSDILQRAVGHLPETALPGEPGNIALAGHRDSFFRPLRNIRSGDAITFKAGDREFQYLVESTMVVPPTDVSVLRQDGGRILTLITCFPFYYLGAAPDRFIVQARQVEMWPQPAR